MHCSTFKLSVLNYLPGMLPVYGLPVSTTRKPLSAIYLRVQFFPFLLVKMGKIETYAIKFVANIETFINSIHFVMVRIYWFYVSKKNNKLTSETSINLATGTILGFRKIIYA